jgi:transposase InsO family protein
VDGSHASSEYNPGGRDQVPAEHHIQIQRARRVMKDNGMQFKGAKFVRYCADFGIQHQPSSAVHPQMNGQVERANGLIL